MLTAIIALIIGLIFLYWSGEKAVLNTQRLSQLLGIDTFFLGFVLLAVATGLPELSVVIASLSEGASYLSLGDLIGSNFTDVAFALGLSIVIAGSLRIKENEFKYIRNMMLLATILMVSIFLMGKIGKIHGVLLLVVYAISLFYLWYKNHLQHQQTITISQHSKLAVAAKLIGSLVLLFGSSRLCVWAAITIVKKTPLSLELFGATIMAIGTSLPEIVLNISAARKKDLGLALGNSLGSVVEQGALLLGILAICSPQPLDISRMLWIAPFIIISYALVGFNIIYYRKLTLFAGYALLAFYGTFLFFSYFNALFSH